MTRASCKSNNKLQTSSVLVGGSGSLLSVFSPSAPTPCRIYSIMFIYSMNTWCQPQKEYCVYHYRLEANFSSDFVNQNSNCVLVTHASKDAGPELRHHQRRKCLHSVRTPCGCVREESAQCLMMHCGQFLQGRQTRKLNFHNLTIW